MNVTICDVGPRDGLQNEPDTLPAATRAALVSRLAAAGLPRIEAVRSSATTASPRWPARRTWRPRRTGDGRAVGPRAERAGLRALRRHDPRPRQLHARGDRVLQPAERQRDARRRRRADAGDPRRGGEARHGHRLLRVGLPVRGRGRPGRRRRPVRAAGRCGELVLADTIGVATPRRVERLVERISILGPRVGAHLHNTRNTGYASAWGALAGGAAVLDASVGGLGGCPFSPNATGNVATEDLVWQLERDGVRTGVDVDALVAVSAWLAGAARTPARGVFSTAPRVGRRARHLRRRQAGRRARVVRAGRRRRGAGRRRRAPVGAHERRPLRARLPPGGRVRAHARRRGAGARGPFRAAARGARLRGRPRPRLPRPLGPQARLAARRAAGGRGRRRRAGRRHLPRLARGAADRRAGRPAGRPISRRVRVTAPLRMRRARAGIQRTSTRGETTRTCSRPTRTSGSTWPSAFRAGSST